jgi:hypothetical protein
LTSCKPDDRGLGFLTFFFFLGDSVREKKRVSTSLYAAAVMLCGIYAVGCSCHAAGSYFASVRLSCCWFVFRFCRTLQRSVVGRPLRFKTASPFEVSAQSRLLLLLVSKDSGTISGSAHQRGCRDQSCSLFLKIQIGEPRAP